ncbi:TIGR03545 family protein [Spirochaeta isovalerica]|uniref:Uncharacterized protein (TIGR03545 family) n=1 Tax=Spirochaeta isovalerica TaxID=150 RepID=A0A841R7I6_9SPIO|nr:TIGR03545 family protein [Spirochaeta isovalerica]MBB6479341.1 uncharacterized protein (TIGR03545 family) [Spirochaeta isovalerica]
MKKQNLPRLFRKSYNEKSLDKKVLKRLHIPADRDLVKALYTDDGEGLLSLRDDLSADQKKKLALLAKAVKKNRGVLTTWKVLIFLIPLAALILFNFIFKDKLLERGAERALETFFQAQADVGKLHLSIIGGEFSFQSLAIADKDSPDFNLLETGPGYMKLAMSELAFKRFRIDEISLSDVRWNTKRQSSGALPAESGQEEKMEAGEEEEQTGTEGISLPSLSPEALVDSISLDSLGSYRMIEERSEQMRGLTDKWSKRFEEKESEIKAIKKEVESLSSLNLNSLSNLQEIQGNMERIGTLKTRIETLTSSVENLADDFKEDRSALVSAGESVSDLIKADLDSLEERLDFSSGGFQTLASDLAESFIRERWNGYYEAGLKVWNIYKRFDSREKADIGKEKKALVRAPGRTVMFPSPDKPQFYVDKVLFSGSSGDNAEFEAEIRSLSNEPEKVIDPVRLDLSTVSGVTTLSGEGILDLREKEAERFSLDFNGRGISADLPDGIPALSIDGFRSDGEISGNISSLDGMSGLESDFSVVLTDLIIEQQDQDGFIGETVRSIFDSLDSIELSGQMEISPKGIETLQIDSDLDSILNNALGAALDSLRKEAIDRLEASLMDRLTPALEENSLLSDGLDKLGLESADQISSLDSLEDILDTKLDELKSGTGQQGGNLLQQAGGALKLPGF